MKLNVERFFFFSVSSISYNFSFRDNNPALLVVVAILGLLITGEAPATHDVPIPKLGFHFFKSTCIYPIFMENSYETSTDFTNVEYKTFLLYSFNKFLACIGFVTVVCGLQMYVAI